MFQEFIASLLFFFVLEPIEAEMNRVLTAANAPKEVVETARDCVADAGPAFQSRIADDFWWGIAQVTYVALGMRRAEEVLVEVTPSCAPTLSALDRTKAEGQS